MDFFLGTLSAKIKPEFRPMAATIVQILAQSGACTTHFIAEVIGADHKSRCRSVLNTMQQIGTVVGFPFKGLDGRNYTRWRLSPETEDALGTYPVVSQMVTEATLPKGMHNWQMENHAAFHGAPSPWAHPTSPYGFIGVPPPTFDMPIPGLSSSSKDGGAVAPAPTPDIPQFSLDRFSTPDPKVRNAMMAMETPSYIPPVSLRIGTEAHREADAYDIHSGLCLNVLPFCSDKPGAIGCIFSNFWNHRYSDPTDQFWCAELHFQYIKVSRYARNSLIAMQVLREMLSLEPIDAPPIGTEGWEKSWKHNQDLCKRIKKLAGSTCPFGDLDLDIPRWDAESFDIMREVLARKFRPYLDSGKRNPLAFYLCATATRWLIEAAYYDKVWGVGLTAGHYYPESKPDETPLTRMSDNGTEEWNIQPADWPGKNLLGKALMQQRTALFASWTDPSRPNFALPIPLTPDA